MQNAFFQPLGFENPYNFVRVTGRGINLEQFYEFFGYVTRFFLEFALRRFGIIFAFIAFSGRDLPQNFAVRITELPFEQNFSVFNDKHRRPAAVRNDLARLFYAFFCYYFVFS